MSRSLGQSFPLRLASAAGVAAALLALSGSAAAARPDHERASRPTVVLVSESVGCLEVFERLVCDGFRKAVRRTGVTGRLVSPTPREDPADTLELAARQRHDLVMTFGFGIYDALARVARRQAGARFALIDAPRSILPGKPRNVQGVVFRTSEAAFAAGWLAGRLERLRPGRDAVGVVGGIPIPSVTDYVIGFGAGARRAAPGIRVLSAYSQNFVDAVKCKAIASRQIARGAGVVFNVAGACGLGTLEAARENGVWAIGVDTDQSYLGSHVLTSVVKSYEAGFLTVLRQVKAGRVRTGGDTVLTLREGAVGLARISPKVPAELRAEVDRLRARIARGDVRVPGAYPDPR